MDNIGLPWCCISWRMHRICGLDLYPTLISQMSWVGERTSSNNTGCTHLCTAVSATGISPAFLKSVLASDLFLCPRLCSDFELWFSVWPEIWFKRFPSSLPLCTCCDLLAGITEGWCAADSWLSADCFRPLWQRAEGFADRSGGVPACWLPECSLQKVCLMMRNLNSMDGRGKRKSDQNCREDTPCFVFCRNTQQSCQTLSRRWCLAASWDMIESLSAPWKHPQLCVN